MVLLGLIKGPFKCILLQKAIILGLKSSEFVTARILLINSRVNPIALRMAKTLEFWPF